MNIRTGIRFRLFLSFLAILLILFAVLFSHTVSNLENSLEEIIEAELASDLRYAWDEYFSVAQLFRSSLQQPATSSHLKKLIQNSDTRGLAEFVSQYRKDLVNADLLLVVDSTGRILAGASSGETGERFGLATVISRALRERQPVNSTETVSPELPGDEGGERSSASLLPKAPKKKLLLQTVVIPVSGDNGRVIGAIVAGEIINHNSRLPLQARKILGSDVEISILQGSEKIAGSQGERAPVVLSPEILKKLEEGLSYRGRANLGNDMFLTEFQPILNSTGRTVGSLSVALSLDSYGKIRRNHLWSLVSDAILGVILSFIVSWFAARQLTQPLRALARSAVKIREGDLSQQVEVRSGGELGELEETFNAMTASLRQRDETIRGRNEELRGLNRELEERVSDRTSELLREKSCLEAILTSMAEGLIVVDQENRVVLLNPSAQKQFETIPSRIIGKPLEMLCESESFFLLLNYLRSTEVKASQVYVVEERVQACGKELVFRVSPLLDASGEYAGMVLAVRDITAEADMERMKGEFYTSVSHEFKTPLTSVKGGLELLLVSTLLTDVREQSLLNICLRNTERLIELTGEILDIARIGAGNLLFVMGPVQLSELMDQALAEVGDAIRSRGIGIVDNLDESLPSVFGDRNRLAKVFSNLLSNAVGASPVGGSVTITSVGHGNYIQVSITDQGAGINRPGRLSSWDSDGVAGTGLGLALCLEIVKEHHGRIEYLAGEDGGTIVRVTLPLGEGQ
jgi:two-component system, OmpR family, sensor histidine kinase VicK